MDEHDTTFKHWKFSAIDCTQLQELTEDIDQIEGELFYIYFPVHSFFFH